MDAGPLAAIIQSLDEALQPGLGNNTLKQLLWRRIWNSRS